MSQISRDKVFSRAEHFKAHLILTAVCIGFYFLIFLAIVTEAGSKAASGMILIYIIGFIHGGGTLMFFWKRLLDIRGEDKNKLEWITGFIFIFGSIGFFSGIINDLFFANLSNLIFKERSYLRF